MTSASKRLRLRLRSRGNPTFGFPLPLGTPFLFPISPGLPICGEGRVVPLARSEMLGRG